MKKPAPAFSPQFRLHVAVFAALLLLDQLTKSWARARFSGADGEPDYTQFLRVLGDWLHLRLVYNHGAAFSMQPQNILPFLHPVVFYTLLTAGAVVFFAFYYRRLGRSESLARLGIALMLAGAVGNNLIDRLVFHKVTDFIDVGIPGFYPRWPVFNIADSSVLIGIFLIAFRSVFPRSKNPPATGEAPSEDPESHSHAG